MIKIGNVGEGGTFYVKYKSEAASHEDENKVFRCAAGYFIFSVSVLHNVYSVWLAGNADCIYSDDPV